MPNTALQRAEELDGADLEHSTEALAAFEHVAASQAEAETLAETARLAKLAGAFGMFGLALCPNDSFAVLDEVNSDAPEPEPAPEEITEYVARIVAEASAEAAPVTGTDLVAFTQTLPSVVEATSTPSTRFTFPTLKHRGVRLSPLHAMRLMQGVDWIVALAAAQAAALWGNGEGLAALTLAQAGAFLLSGGALKAGLWLTDLYRTPPGKLRAEHGAGGLALGVVAGLIIAAFTAPDARSAAALAATLPLAGLLLAGAHAAFAVLIGALHKNGAFQENIVLVGATEAAERLVRRAAERGDARIVAVVDDRLGRAPNSVAGAPVTGSIEELLRWEGLPHVDRIVVTVTQKAESRVRAMIEKLRVVPNRIDLLLDYDTFSVRGRKLDRLTGAAMACVSGRPHHAGRALVKRAQDLVLASLLAIVFAPVMAAIALAVKLDSPGPALYRQRRHGFNNRIITVLKFRTMRDEPGAPMRQVEPNDPRITRIGQFLRRTSLDELPQLFNVLKGDMSLVGPRPHAVGMRAADRDLTHIVCEYAHRHQVKPGITGWAQVNGSRGPIATPTAVRERLKLDLDYVSRASLWLDLAILLRTAPALLGDRKSTR